MLKNIFMHLAASAVAFTVVCLPLATSTFATSCDDIQFIFARGSGQKYNAPEYSAFASNIKQELVRNNSTLKVSFHELQYPAVELDFFTVLGASISAGKAFKFGESVNQGINELKNHIEDVVKVCNNTKFILAGYSQGAMVMINSTDVIDPSSVLYVATFGDPKLYLPEGKGLFPDACRGKNLSPYRVFAPNCRTSAGSLGAKNPYQPNDWSGKIGLWCKDKDLVCGAGVKMGDIGSAEGSGITKIVNAALASHLTYADDGIFVAAAKTIVEKIGENYPKKLSATVSSSKANRDTVILLDRTGSMSPYIEKYKAEARRLARETLSAGGRVALFTYGDLIDGGEPNCLADFGSSYLDISSALDTIYTNGGDDEPESFYSAALNIMNQQKWRASATKSIIALTDASALNPDRDGVTPAQVASRSLEIDPVNIYVICEDEATAKTYEPIVTATGGKIFTSVDSMSTDYLLTRPRAEFPHSDYYGAPGDEFTFTAITSSDTIRFEWDLDFDGIFETETLTNTVSTTYPNAKSGFIQLRATNTDGISSTASAKVTVSTETPPISTIYNLKASEEPTGLKISYSYGENTVATLLSLNNATLGITSENSFLITDLDGENILTLTPLSSTGELGQPRSLRLNGKIIALSTETNSELVVPLAPKTGQR